MNYRIEIFKASIDQDLTKAFTYEVTNFVGFILPLAIVSVPVDSDSETEKMSALSAALTTGKLNHVTPEFVAQFFDNKININGSFSLYHPQPVVAGESIYLIAANYF